VAVTQIFLALIILKQASAEIAGLIGQLFHPMSSIIVAWSEHPFHIENSLTKIQGPCDLSSKQSVVKVLNWYYVLPLTLIQWVAYNFMHNYRTQASSQPRACDSPRLVAWIEL